MKSVLRVSHPRDFALLTVTTASWVVLTLAPFLSGAGASEIPLGMGADSEYIDQYGRSAAALEGSGNAAIWLEEGTPRSLKMQWLDVDSQPLFEANGRRIVGNGNPINSFDIVTRPGGGVFVGFLQEGANSLSHGYAQAFDSSGDPLWPEPGARITALSESQLGISLTPGPDGGLYACVNLSQSGQVRCQHIDADGNLLWDPLALSAGGADGCRIEPFLINDDSDGVMVFWRNQGDPFDGMETTMFIEGQRFTSDGTSMWGSGLMVRETQQSENCGFSANFMGGVSDGEGGALLAFDFWTGDAASGLDVLAQRVTRDGLLPWGSEGAVVVDDTESTEHQLSLSAPDDGLAVVTRHFPAAGGSQLRVFRLDKDGNHVWPPEGLQVSDPAETGSNYFPCGSFGGGYLHLGWTRAVPAPVSSFDIYLARVRPDGIRVGPFPGSIVTDAFSTQFCHELVYSESQDSLFVLWEDLRNGGFDNIDIYAADIPASLIFGDDFESGDVAAWTRFEP